MESAIEIFQSSDGTIQLDVHLEQDTVWLTHAQMAKLFGRERSVITKHINNVFKEGELEKESVCANFARTAADGKSYNTQLLNLDVIISVGYRVKSQRGVQFRQWATTTLKQHLVKGYTFNQMRLESFGADFNQLMDLMQRTLQNHELANAEGLMVTQLISSYARSWTLLQAYDEQTLEEPENESESLHSLEEKEAVQAIGQLKSELMKRGEATDLFGKLTGKGLGSALGAIEQTFDGQSLYPTINSRAAHLLYFIIKNHPFTDGNKRIGSFLFLFYLERNKASKKPNGICKISDNAMVPLALLIAESDPKQKELLIRLVQHLLEGGN